MSFADYEQALLDPFKDDQAILDQFFHTGQSYCFLGARPEEESRLKGEIVGALINNFNDKASINLKLHPMQLVTCGSGHLGFSPTPGGKLGQPFDSRRSDIDIAIVHEPLFELWWSEIRDADQDVITMRDTVVENIFNGFIDPQYVNRATEIGSIWWETFGKIETNRAKGVRGRLYKNHWAMQRYHREAIVQAKAQLEGRVV